MIRGNIAFEGLRAGLPPLSQLIAETIGYTAVALIFGGLASCAIAAMILCIQHMRRKKGAGRKRN